MRPKDKAIVPVWMHLALKRAVGNAFYQSDTARDMAPFERKLTPKVCCVAAALPHCEVLRGAVVHPLRARGAIRLGLR